MNEIILSDELKNTSFVVYAYNAAVRRLSPTLPSPSLEFGARACILVDREQYLNYRPVFLSVAADVVAVGKKYAYFSDRLRLNRLSDGLRTDFLVSVVAADLPVDVRLVKERLLGDKTFTLDGVFSFSVGALKRKWDRVLSAIPPDISKAEAENFLEYIVSGNKGRAYISEEGVFDSKFMPVDRSKLLPVKESERVKADVLLSGAGEVFVEGNVKKTTLDFLKRYYATKSFFTKKSKKG